MPKTWGGQKTCVVASPNPSHDSRHWLSYSLLYKKNETNPANIYCRYSIIFIAQCRLCSIDYVKTYLARHSSSLNTLS